MLRRFESCRGRVRNRKGHIMFKYRRSRETAPEFDAYLQASQELGEDKVAVCPVHLKFVPCRRCRRDGTDYTSTDPVEIEKVRQFQVSGLDDDRP
jgi:hypothetical protein